MEQPSVARRWRWWYQLALFIAMGGLFISTAQRTGVRMAIAQPTGRAAPESDVDNRVRLVAKSREERADVVRVVEAWGLLVGSRIQLPNPITPLSHAMLKKWLDEWRRKVLSLDEFQGPLSGDRVTLSGEEQELLDLLRDMRRHSILFDRGAASFSDRVAGFRAWL